MLFHLIYPLHVGIGVFNVFRYITFRSALAALTALLLSLLLGPWLIAKLRERQIGQEIREEGPRSHEVKRGTPTMGGLLIIPSIIVPSYPPSVNACGPPMRSSVPPRFRTKSRVNSI